MSELSDVLTLKSRVSPQHENALQLADLSDLWRLAACSLTAVELVPPDSCMFFTLLPGSGLARWRRACPAQGFPGEPWHVSLLLGSRFPCFLGTWGREGTVLTVCSACRCLCSMRPASVGLGGAAPAVPVL